MEEPPCPAPSGSARTGALPASPDSGNSRPRAVVTPTILEGDRIIRPVSRENLNIQVAVIKVGEHGQYYFIRTGALILDRGACQSRDPYAPVPVALPNTVPIANIASVLPTELMQIILPNVLERHQEMLTDLEREENRVLSLRWTVNEMERQRSSVRVTRAWSRALQAMGQDMEDRMPQALEFEHYASIFSPEYQPQSPPPAVQPGTRSNNLYRRLRANRRRRSTQSRQLDPLRVISCPLEACRVFLGQVRALAQGEPGLERAVRILVQLLVDDVLTPEQFCRRLERLLGADAQPYLTNFLTANIHRLRQSLYLNLSSLENIDRPERHVAFPVPPPLLEMPPVQPPPEPARSEPDLPIAAVAPLQPVPLSHIPYDLPLPLAPIHVWQVEKGGLPGLIKTVPQEGDVHLYNPCVGYVHLRVMPTTNSFQLGDTTIRLLPKETPPTTDYDYVYRY